MGTADIQAEINSIPAKKQDLRKAFEELESYSSSFASFMLQWKHIDDHFSSIEKSIEKRFQELKAKMAPGKPTADVSAANVKVDQDEPVIEPCHELKSLCVKMDAKGLRSYIIEHRKDTEAMRRELGPALLCSPDPISLVLDSFEGFARSSEMTEVEKLAIRRAFLTIMEYFHGLKLEVKPSEKERARQLATEYDDMVTNGKRDNAVVVMVFLHLIATFGLLEHFAIDRVLDLLVTVAKKKNIVDLCRNSALEEKIPDLIDKLNKMGRQLDSVKFVLAFNLQHKFPPASLFKSYIKESKKGSQEGSINGNNSAQAKHVAISKQIIAIKAVMKAVEEYNLGSQYPLSSLQHRIQQLEQQRSAIKRAASAIPKLEKQRSAIKRAAPAIPKGPKKHHQPPNKRLRPSSDPSPTLLPPQPRSQIPLNSAPTVLPLHQHPQNQPQLGLVDRTPYTALAGSYGLVAAPPSFYGPGDPAGLGPKPYGYASAGSAYYDRPVPYGGYSSSGFTHYNPPPYP